MRHEYGRKCIFLNGPSGAGKDTAAMHIRTHFGSINYKFMKPVKEAVRAFFNIPPDTWRKIMNDQELKLSCNYFAPNKTYLDLLCDWAEYFQETLGDNILGRIAASHLSTSIDPCKLYTISDARFPREVLPVINAFGERNCAIIHIERPEYDDYVVGGKIELEAIPHREIMNEFDMFLFEQQCIKAVRELFPELSVKEEQ